MATTALVPAGAGLRGFIGRAWVDGGMCSAGILGEMGSAASMRGTMPSSEGALSMAITVRTEGNVSIVQLTGEFTLGHMGLARPLDLHGHRLEDLGETLGALLDRGACRVVLDLEKVRFIDSAGLGDLVGWKKRALQLGGDIRLLRARDRIRDILELTALARLFQVFDDEAEAVASFR